MYISCSCSYRRESGCGDFLFIPGHDCRPVLLPLADVENFLGTRIDRTVYIWFKYSFKDIVGKNRETSHGFGAES